MTDSMATQERLYIGELVDWLDADVSAGDHPEVTVIGPLEWIEWEMTENQTINGSGLGYSVLYRDGGQGCELAINLRRKLHPPNPDAVTETRGVECA